MTPRRVRHSDGWELKEMPLRPRTLLLARRGDAASQKQISMSFRDRIKHETGADPGKVAFDELEFL